MQVARINEAGLKQIADALGRHHKLGRDHFTESMLMAWAQEAEDHFNDCGVCYFEIRSFDSNSGGPVVVSIDAAGFEIEVLNIE
jgi:hypothetical protein